MPEIVIDIDGASLPGNIQIPEGSHQLIIFAHGSGSSRFSPRNQYVAKALNRAGMATCLFDLLTAEEEQVDIVTREFRFDIAMLSRRLAAVTNWLQVNYSPYQFHFGYFGSSTGAAAALVASTECNQVRAIVSRGGRVDLAGKYLAKVTAATLMVVGGYDDEVIALNRDALNKLHAVKELTIIPQASHLFEEPGALDKVIELAIAWFKSN
jgi:putative phosphoribosyl transferase